MSISQGAIDDFLESWDAAASDDFADRMERRSLAALADQVPEFKAALSAHALEGQTQLRLHVDGTSVVDHTAKAEYVAKLIRGISDATKEIAKAQLKLGRRAATLRVAALSPGSVEITLRAAPGTKVHQGVFPRTATPSVDSEALEAVARILARAGMAADGGEDDVLSALAASTTAAAHGGLRQVAKAIAGEGWDVEGELNRAGVLEEFHVGPEGARGLLQVLAESRELSEVAEMIGAIDGQRRSIAALWFAPEGGTSIEAAVPTAELFERIVQLDLERARTRAVFDVVSIVGPGAHSKPRRVYTLRSIARAETPTTLDDATR